MRKANKANISTDYNLTGLICITGEMGVGVCDNTSAMISVAKESDLYVHVDATTARSAMMCQKFRHRWQGVDDAGSVVLNPHKWLDVRF